MPAGPGNGSTVATSPRAWELLSWLFVAAVVVWGVLAFVPGVDEADRGFAPGDLTGLCGVVTGLVLSELRLRKAERGA